MKGFFHSLGRGILYFLTPFIWVVGISLGSVVALVVFLGYAVYFIFCFFTGRNLFNDLPEDKRAKEILAAQADALNPQPQPQPQPAQTQVYMNNPQVNLYQNPGYPYPPQGQPYPQQPNPYMQPQPSVQVAIQPQPAPLAAQEAPQIEEQHEPESIDEIEEPSFEEVEEPEIEESEGYDTIETAEEDEEIEEYVPHGGDVFKKDIKDDYND